MTIWIVGASGLLGSALKALVPSALTSSRKEVDIADLAAIRLFARKHPGIHQIINCAACSQVDYAEEHPEEAYLSNAIGPENLAVLATEIGAHLIHISTDYVFPGHGAQPLKETDPVDPVNYYGQTKLEGEQRVEWTMPSACIVRISSLFGQGGKNFLGKLLPALNRLEPIFLANDQCNRFTYAPDLARVLLQMQGRSGIYHFANADPATKYEFGTAMKEFCLEMSLPALARVEGKSVLSFPSICKRPLYTVFDTSKIEKELRIQLRPWHQALQESLKEHVARLAPC